MLPFKIQTQSEFTAITLDEAKAQCRVTFDIDDSEISSIILDAADAAQEYLNWMVSTGTVKQYVATGGTFYLYGGYVKSITEITAIDSTGSEVTLTTADYSFNEITEEITVSTIYTDVYVTYECGATSVELPKGVRRGILMLISTLYNNREDFITGLSVEKMPTTSTRLLQKYRHYVS